MAARRFHGFLGGFFQQSFGVLGVAAAVVVQLGGEQAGHFRRFLAQRCAGLVDGALEGGLHTGLRFLLVPVGGLQQGFECRMRRFR